MNDDTAKALPLSTSSREGGDSGDGQTKTFSHTNRGSSRGSGRLEVRCPSCHAPMDVAVDTALTDLTCASCGAHFSLVDPGNATRMAPPLSKLGRFELIERLGVGGYGSVWKARDKELDRTVAIKVPRAGGMSPEEQEKFFREARAAAQLLHSNIVSVHEVGRDGDSVYIVSDFVRGVTLADWLTGQKLTSREAVELCAKIADALHHAHEQGVVHRDLKPANIMMDGDGEPHLMDFGLARRDAGEVTMTTDGHVLGTPAYMSPEQAEGKAHTADRRSDVYSLGVILFQLLTGELPFRGNARMLMHQVIHDEPPSPRKLNGNVPRDLETITLKCLEKEPDRRYQSAKDLGDEFGRFLAGEPIDSRPISRVAQAWRWTRRNALVTTLGAAFVLALVIGTAVSTFMAIRANQSALRFSEQRDLAESNLQLAENAVDDYLTRVADDERLKRDDFHSLRTQLLETAVPFYEQFARQKPGDVPSEVKRAGAYARLATIHGMTGQPELSTSEYQQAIAMEEELTSKYQDVPAYRRDLANHHAELGWNMLVVGNKSQAEPHYKEALALLSKLAEDFPNEPAYRHKLAVVHEQYGLLSQAAERKRAREHLENAIRLEETLLATSPDNIEYQSELAVSSFRLGFLLLRDEPKIARDNLRTAADIQRKIVAAKPKEPEYRAALAESLAHLGAVSNSLGDSSGARQLCEEAVEIQTDVVTQFPGIVKYRVILAGIHTSFAIVLRKMGDDAGAGAQDQFATDVRKQSDTDFPEVATARTRSSIGEEYIHPSIAEIRSSIGKEVIVEFRVQRTGGNDHRYLNSKLNFNHEDTFTAVVQPNQIAAFDKKFSTPHRRLVGKVIRVTGEVTDRRGQMQILISDLATQLEVVDPPATAKAQ